MYVPELIFGNLLTGSNFDDDQKKTTGGRNGFGAKVRMETCDTARIYLSCCISSFRSLRLVRRFCKPF